MAAPGSRRLMSKIRSTAPILRRPESGAGYATSRWFADTSAFAGTGRPHHAALLSNRTLSSMRSGPCDAAGQPISAKLHLGIADAPLESWPYPTQHQPFIGYRGEYLALELPAKPASAGGRPPRKVGNRPPKRPPPEIARSARTYRPIHTSGRESVR